MDVACHITIHSNFRVADLPRKYRTERKSDRGRSSSGFVTLMMIIRVLACFTHSSECNER